MKLKTLITFLVFNTIALHAQIWSTITSPVTARINSCTFVNQNTGWIVTNDAIYKTTNGGTSWVSQNFPAAPSQDTRFFNSIHFINENVGIVACGNYLYSGHDPNLVSTILWTNDGGLNWIYKDLGSYNDYDSSAVLVTPLIAYSIGQYGQSKKTIDGGMTWAPCDFSGVGYSGRNLFALDESHVYFAGLQNLFLTGAIGKMNNATWAITNFPETIAMSRIFFIDNNTGWTAGNDGAIKITNDGGNTWVDGNSGITSNIYGISFTNAQQGWAVTSDGKMLKTVDGGLNWTTYFSSNVSLNDITFKNLNGYGYAVGNNGQIFKYSPNLRTDTFDANAFSIYPNPTASLINVNTNSATKITTVEIYNAIGQMVKNIENCDSSLLSFDKGNLSSGIYYLKILGEGNVISTKKLVITD